MTHYTERHHYFRDENDDRTTVVTRLLPDNQYEAELLEHPVLDLSKDYYGHGGTRMEAIVDLQQHIDLELNK